MDFEQSTRDLFAFIEKSPSPYHSVAAMIQLLEAEGFVPLQEWEKWKLELGGRYYVCRNQSAILAFTLPKKDFKRFQIIASHSDSPCFKVKENAVIEVENHYVKLNTECYGGMIFSSWMDRPLSLAGRVMVKTKNGVAPRLVHIDRDLLIIPNLAIHMQREINNGYKFNAQVDMLPLLGTKFAGISQLLAQELGETPENILSSDLYLYPRVKGTILGAGNELIACPRLDDLQCAFASIRALLQSENSKAVRLAAVFDNEEVGSGTKQGAGSTFLLDTLSRICEGLGKNGQDYRVAVAQSFMLSADNAHGVHPNFADKSDATNKNYLNGGPVIKFSANQKYTTDSASASVFRLICEKAGVPYQVFHNRSDMQGGSTLGNISNGQVSLNTVDIGIAQLAMHAAVETAGVQDTAYMMAAMQTFYGADLTVSATGIAVK